MKLLTSYQDFMDNQRLILKREYFYLIVFLNPNKLTDSTSKLFKTIEIDNNSSVRIFFPGYPNTCLNVNPNLTIDNQISASGYFNITFYDYAYKDFSNFLASKLNAYSLENCAVLANMKKNGAIVSIDYSKCKIFEFGKFEENGASPLRFVKRIVNIINSYDDLEQINDLIDSTYQTTIETF